MRKLLIDACMWFMAMGGMVAIPIFLTWANLYQTKELNDEDQSDDE